MELHQYLLVIEGSAIIAGLVYLGLRIIMARTEAITVKTRIVTREEAVKLLRNTFNESPDPKRVAEEAVRLGSDYYRDGFEAVHIQKGRVVQGRYLLAGMILANKELRFTVMEYK